MPPAATTVISTVLGVKVAGEVAVIEVAEFTMMLVALVDPNFTPVDVLTLTKLVPVIDTDVPPPLGPLVGLTDVTVGAAA